MDFLSFLANLLLSVTVGTLTVALIAYLAQARRGSRPPAPSKLPAADDTPVFVQRYVPDSGKRPESIAGK